MTPRIAGATRRRYTQPITSPRPYGLEFELYAYGSSSRRTGRKGPIVTYAHLALAGLEPAALSTVSRIQSTVSLRMPIPPQSYKSEGRALLRLTGIPCESRRHRTDYRSLIAPYPACHSSACRLSAPLHSGFRLPYPGDMVSPGCHPGSSGRSLYWL